MKKSIKSIPDFQLLYELSLAIGQSCDMAENSELFLKALLRLKALDSAAVWWEEPSGYNLLAHTGTLVLSKISSEVLTRLELPNNIISFCSYSANGSTESKNLPAGSYAFYRLKNGGLLGFYKLDKAAQFVDSELVELESVVAKFNHSLLACQSFQTLAQERQYHQLHLTQTKDTQQALRESEERYRILFENAFDGITIFDVRQNKPIACNPKVLEYFRVSKEFFLSATPLDFSPPFQPDGRSSKESRDEILRNIDDQKMFRYEWQHRRPNGELFDTEVSTFTMPAPNEHLRISIFRDITESKKATQALQKSENSLQEAQHLARMGSWEYDIEKSRIKWSLETFNLFKMDPLAGEPTFDNYFQLLVHPQDKEKLLEATMNALQKALPFAVESRQKTIDGETIYTLNIGKAIQGNGKIVRLVGTTQDITERKLAEQKILENSLKYTQLFDNMYDAIVVTDAAGRMIDSNKSAQKMLGYSHEELSQLKIPQIVHPDDQERSKQYLQKLETDGYYSDYQGRILCKDGQVVYVQVNSNAIYEDGKIVGSRDIVRDITDVKKAESKREELLLELEQVNKELQDFAYVVSHDLKAPLRAISSLSQWLKEDHQEKLGVEGAQQIDLLVNRANRMHNFIEAILEYSRIGRIRQKEEWIDLNRVIEITREMLEIPANFTIVIPEELPFFFGQKMRIIQIFQNLIGNAIKYNDKSEGVVTIRWEDTGSHYKFWLRDNGPGIEAQYYKKVFKIFQTLQSRDMVESTGIGLTIVKRIVQLYEGQISINSVVGEHTTFEFTLKKH